MGARNPASHLVVPLYACVDGSLIYRQGAKAAKGERQKKEIWG